MALMTIPTIERSALVALLGYTKPIPKTYRRYSATALLMAKRRVACRWGRGRAPKFREFLTDLIHCQEQLATYAELLPCTSRAKDIWGPLTQYLLIQPRDAEATLPAPHSPQD